jgi:hypothetical protein
MFLPTSRRSSVTRTTLSLFLLSKDVLSVRDLQLRSHRFGARKTNYELVFFPLSALHNIVSSIKSFRSIFDKFRAPFGADTLLFQVCHCLDRGEWAHSKHLRKSRYCSETLYSAFGKSLCTLLPSRKTYSIRKKKVPPLKEPQSVKSNKYFTGTALQPLFNNLIQ